MNKQMIGALLISMAASAAMSEEAKADKAATTDKKAEHVCQNNTCKGKADCMGFGNDSCKGSNECKGHGTLKAKGKAACTKKGGLWVAKVETK